MIKNVKLNNWMAEKFFDISKYALRGHVIYILSLITLAVTLYPSTFANDCRANYQASINLQGIIDIMIFPIVGMIFGLVSYMTWDIIKTFHLGDEEPLEWKTWPETIWIFLLSATFLTSVFLAWIMFYVATKSIYMNIQDGTKWEYVKEEQKKATIECAKAQGIILPDGWSDPWMPLTSSQPSFVH